MYPGEGSDPTAYVGKKNEIPYSKMERIIEKILNARIDFKASPFLDLTSARNRSDLWFR